MLRATAQARYTWANVLLALSVGCLILTTGACSKPTSDPSLAVGSTIQRTLDDLVSGDKRRRLEASYHLRKLGPSDGEAVSPLATVLQTSRDPLVLKCALKSLSQIGPDAFSAVPDVIHIWEIDPVMPWAFFQESDAGDHKTKRADDSWDGLLQNDLGTSLALMAEKWLLDVGVSAIPTLLASTRDGKPVVRMWSMKVLRTLDAKRVRAVLVHSLRDQARDVRHFAVVLTIQDSIPTDENVLQILEEAANRRDAIGYRCRDRLNKLGPKPGTPLPKNLLDNLAALNPKLSHDRPALQRLIDQIGSFGPEASEAVEPLLRLMKESEFADVHLSCIWALRRIGPKAKLALPTLTKFANPNGDARLAETALSAIEKIDPELGTKERERYNRNKRPSLPNDFDDR